MRILGRRLRLTREGIRRRRPRTACTRPHPRPRRECEVHRSGGWSKAIRADRVLPGRRSYGTRSACTKQAATARARIEAAIEQGALVRVARIGLVAALVYGRTLIPSMSRCAHGRRDDCVADAIHSPPARRHWEFPPLRAAPTREDAALQGRRRAPRRLARDSGGR